MPKVHKLHRNSENPEVQKTINIVEMYGILIFVISTLLQFLIIPRNFFSIIQPLLFLLKPFLPIIIIIAFMTTSTIITIDWLKSPRSPILKIRIKHQLKIFADEFIPEGVEIQYLVHNNYKESADKIRVILYSNGYLEESEPARIGRKLSEWFNIPLRSWIEDEQITGHYVFDLSYRKPIRQEVNFDI
ncbi:hypothetical protein GYN24_05725 [Lactococcus piscium]|uniref:Uncharacterized protein n=1 Tax=Pseudolactococcus paracarnosus TaxID=2749962 RepID=A0A7L4WD66_9LACT|nr:hypothetical protein [Lactococcus paracarnosus]MCJ1994077.1 hypothetical protein [Lactococcus paracarnosus]QDJ27413.1 hypothetical protein BHS01_01995 [Lactococcus paracarnosus]SPC36752.1 conserved hypothetical protein [Lactococcus piscium]